MQAALASSSASVVVLVLQSHSTAPLPTRCSRVCVHVCVHMCMSCVCACAYEYISIYVRSWIPACTSVRVCVRACVACMHACVCAFLHVCAHFMCVFMCVCVCLRLRLCMHLPLHPLKVDAMFSIRVQAIGTGLVNHRRFGYFSLIALHFTEKSNCWLGGWRQAQASRCIGLRAFCPRSSTRDL